MPRLCCVVVIGAFALHAVGQQLSLTDKAVMQAARAKYYNLELQGFMSATCNVNFDLSAMPFLKTKDREPDRKVLEATRFTLHLDSRQQPSAEVVYRTGTSDAEQQHYAPITQLLRSVVVGFFQTWPSKGLDGPIPPFDTQIESVLKTDSGYTLGLRVPGAPVLLNMDKDYLVTEITSVGGKIDERPKYISSPQGLLFASNIVTDDTQKDGLTETHYEIQSDFVNGLMLPVQVHLLVNQNIDVKFSLTDCSVIKGKVIEVKAP